MAATIDAYNAPSNVDVDIDEDRTIITATGGDEAAVVVRSESGEQIYLPPERDDDYQDNSSYEPTGSDTPYDGAKGDSPYGATRQEPVSVGLNKTTDGFRILHPEPITDIRLLR